MKRKALMAICLSVFACVAVFANNIATSNVKLAGQNTGAHTTQVQFDVTWDNSWRTSSGPANWDAAWLFVKFRINGGPWRHASLNASGAVAPAGSTIDIGLSAPGTAFNITSNPGVGAFLYRSANGSGSFTVTGAQLQWNYGANGVGDNDLVDVQVYGIEEVYVPRGAYWLGSGAGSQSNLDYGSFYKYPTETNPFQVNSENALTVGTGTDNLYYYNSFNNPDLGDLQGPVPAVFPKGYNAFYCMKYELSQQGYVDFLNNLNYTQSRTHLFTGSNFRYQVDTAFGSSTVLTHAPYIACTFISWGDLAAYLAWAGLRPMTELEFEKACRGTLTPVPSENAWGTPYLPTFAYTIANQNLSNEIITDHLSTYSPVGNASYHATNSTGGPLRVGIFAASTTGLSNAGRILSGATYYGIMEMSGNVFERAVSIGDPEGRVFTGTHGNGTLNATGFATNADWPSATTAVGIGQRGGSWQGARDSLKVSERRFSTSINPGRSQSMGGRGVRTAP